MQIDIEANSSIGEESSFEGRFAIRGSLRIDGRFEGQALLVDQLQIGPKGRVKTNIIATSVVVEGLIIGTAAYMGLPIAALAQQMKTGVQSMGLLTIPLFIIAGEIMSEGGISRRLDQAQRQAECGAGQQP